MTKRRFVIIVAAVGCSIGAGRSGNAQVQVTKRTPLLQTHGVAVVSTLGPVATEIYTNDTLLIFTDGFTIRNTVSANIAQGEPFVAQVHQGISPAAFAILVQALASNQIGFQSGNCSIDPVTTHSAAQAPAGDSFDAPGITTITWYGRHSRTISLKVGDSFQEECAQAVKNIVQAIGAYETEAFPISPPS